MITVHENVMKGEEKGLSLLSLWVTEERGKDLNLSGRNYDRTLRLGTQPGSSHTGRSALVMCTAYLH